MHKKVAVSGKIRQKYRGRNSPNDFIGLPSSFNVGYAQTNHENEGSQK